MSSATYYITSGILIVIMITAILFTPINTLAIRHDNMGGDSSSGGGGDNKSSHSDNNNNNSHNDGGAGVTSSGSGDSSSSGGGRGDTNHVTHDSGTPKQFLDGAPRQFFEGSPIPQVNQCCSAVSIKHPIQIQQQQQQQQQNIHIIIRILLRLHHVHSNDISIPYKISYVDGWNLACRDNMNNTLFIQTAPHNQAFIDGYNDARQGDGPCP